MERVHLGGFAFHRGVTVRLGAGDAFDLGLNHA